MEQFYDADDEEKSQSCMTTIGGGCILNEHVMVDVFPSSSSVKSAPVIFPISCF